MISYASKIKGSPNEKNRGDHQGAEYQVDFIPKIKLEIIVDDSMAQIAVETIIKFAKTGKIGDGKIFISSLDEAIRIRTGEIGKSAI
ncbi:MAG: P-II family nitrogen regulator [Deltaproteobacteria bacterium]|nr:P-II family nitrogen regulator [Deltaproteobacteria bacterium]